ncbi:MAG: hypothetical protein OEW18_01030, partial [Candidatus Aminicenantes bacterium]|nr:hypothetical protein [Candidatus Aminicenantes bacterium]
DQLINTDSAMNLGTFLGTPMIERPEKTMQVVDNKVVGDRGFEPLTSPVCRIDGKKRKRRK